MTGPSSSHTAGPSKIGFLARHLLGSEPQSVTFTFNEGGSFAASFDSQGTDRGLTGGMLGFRPDDLRMLDALKEAKNAGLHVEFRTAHFAADHPNTVIIHAHGKDGDEAQCRGISVGGGMIIVQEINGFPVCLNGKSWELLVFAEAADQMQSCRDMIYKESDKATPEVIKKSSSSLIRCSLTHEPEKALIRSLRSIAACVRVLPPVFPILDQPEENVPFRTGSEMLSWAEKEHLTPGQAGLYYEAAKGGTTPEEVMKIAFEVLDIMETGIRENLVSKRPGRLIKACSGDYTQKSGSAQLIDLGAADRIIAYSMAMVERNSYYKTIVAAPTCGACGTVPGTILGIADYTGVNREKRAMALLAAGAIGLLIADQATFAAEIAGCQAECGAASAMAAAAAVELMGGTVLEAQEAASLALQNVLGLICDSVANLVEVPCLGRNVMGGVNAAACANMVMAGARCVIPVDETIQSMLAVGNLMPPELCCTNNGGLAITKTSLELAEKIRLYGTAVS